MLTEKHYKVSFSINSILKDEIEEKKSTKKGKKYPTQPALSESTWLTCKTRDPDHKIGITSCKTNQNKL
jgi:hypothetical protein